MGTEGSCCYHNTLIPQELQPQLHAKANPVCRSSQATQADRESISRRSGLQNVKGLQFLPGNNKTTINDFEIVKKIGMGSYGHVVAGYHKRTRKQINRKMYAIKQLNKTEIKKGHLQENIKMEKEIMTKPTSPFITQLSCAFKDNSSYFLAMEYAQGGDIFDLINTKDNMKKTPAPLDEESIRFILGCTIMGLEYLHNKNIIYQDMKPENLLLFGDGYVKIADFGLSEKFTKLLKEMHVGTPQYFAPEMLLGMSYCKSIDLWALGVLAFELANGQLPFPYEHLEKEEEYVQMIKNGFSNLTWKNKKISSSFKDFVGSLLKYEPSERLGYKGWSSVKKNKFFTEAKFNWQALENITMQSPLLKLQSWQKKGQQKTRGKLNFDFKAKKAESKNDDLESLSDWSIDLQFL